MTRRLRTVNDGPGDWSTRDRRAFSSQRSLADALLEAEWTLLRRLKKSLCSEAGLLVYAGAKVSRRLTRQIVDYYRAEGRLLRHAERLGVIPIRAIRSMRWIAVEDNPHPPAPSFSRRH